MASAFLYIQGIFNSYFIYTECSSLSQYLIYKDHSFQMVRTTTIATIWNPTFKNSRFQMVRFQIHTVFHLKMVVDSILILPFENQTIWHQTSFLPFKNRACPVFRSPLYVYGSEYWISLVFRSWPCIRSVLQHCSSGDNEVSTLMT